MEPNNQQNNNFSPTFWLLVTVFSSLSAGVIGSSLTAKYLGTQYQLSSSDSENVLAARTAVPTTVSGGGSGALIKQIMGQVDVNLRREIIDTDVAEQESNGGGAPDTSADYFDIYDSRW